MVTSCWSAVYWPLRTCHLCVETGVKLAALEYLMPYFYTCLCFINFHFFLQIFLLWVQLLLCLMVLILTALLVLLIILTIFITYFLLYEE